MLLLENRLSNHLMVRCSFMRYDFITRIRLIGLRVLLLESRIKRSNYLFGIGVLYCLYAIYACGFDAMVGSAVAVSIGLVIYVLRKAWDTRRAHRLQQSID